MWSKTLFSIRGIEIKIHATFAIIVALGAMQWGMAHGARGALFGVAFTLALFTCVLLHELGHGFVAQHFGLKVKEVVLLPIGGVASLVGTARSPAQEIAIAIAGPLVNVFIALALGAGLYFSGSAASLPAEGVGKLAPSLQTFWVLLTAGNVTLALFNLLPFFPLDGGRILRAGLAMKLGEARATRWAAGLGQVAGVGMAGFALASGQLVLGLIGLLLFMAATRELAAAVLDDPLRALSAGDVAEVPAVELDASARVGDALHHLLRTSQEAFPLVSEGELRGVVLRAELLRAAGRPELRLHSIRTLAQRVPELPSQLSAAEALKLLEELDAPLGVVITPDYPLGFISRAQVLSKLAQLPTSHWPPPPGSRPGLGAPGANPQGPRMAGRDEGAY